MSTPGEAPVPFPPQTPPLPGMSTPGEGPAPFPPQTPPLPGMSTPGEGPAPFPPHPASVPGTCKPGEDPNGVCNAPLKPPARPGETWHPDVTFSPEVGHGDIGTCDPNDKPLWEQVWTAARITGKAWGVTGGPVVDEVYGALKIILGETWRSTVLEAPVVSDEITEMMRQQWDVLSEHGPEYARGQFKVVSDGVRQLSMRKLAGAGHNTIAMLEAGWYISNMLADIAVVGFESQDWAGLPAKVSNVLQNKTQLVADRLVELARQARDEALDEDFDLVDLSPYVGLYEGFRESGEQEYLLNGATEADYLQWIEHEVSTIYRDEDTARKVTRVISGFPAEMAMEKLQSARELFKELQQVYTDDFSVDHAMSRLQGLGAYVLEHELYLIRLYTQDPNLARQHIISVIPADKREMMRPTVDSLGGMTVEQMLHKMMPMIAKQTSPNIGGVYGPSLLRPVPVKIGRTPRIPAQSRYNNATAPGEHGASNADPAQLNYYKHSPSLLRPGVQGSDGTTEYDDDMYDDPTTDGTFGHYMKHVAGVAAAGVGGVAYVGWQAYGFMNGMGIQLDYIPAGVTAL